MRIGVKQQIGQTGFGEKRPGYSQGLRAYFSFLLLYFFLIIDNKKDKMEKNERLHINQHNYLHMPYLYY